MATIPELVKFRQKYPDYGDMDDATLAGKLAAKYPDAYGDLPSKVKTAGVTPLTKAPAARPPKDDFWWRTEPLKLAGEAVAAPINALVKAGKGYKGLYAAGKSLVSGEGIDTALARGTEAIGQRDAIQSPLGPSKTGQFLSGKVVQPTVNLLSRATGQPELVSGAVEAGGDIASLLGVKPALRAATGGAKNLLRKLPESGIPYTSPEKLYGSAAKMPLSKAWVKQAGESGVAKRTAAIKAGLEGEVPISEVGIAKAKTLEKNYRNLVDSAIASLDEKGTLIPKEQLRAGLESAYKVAGTEGTESAKRIVDRLYDARFEKMGRMVKTGERQIPAQPARYGKGAMGEDVLIEPAKPARTEPIFERKYKPSEIQAIKRHLYKMENYEKQKLSRGLGSQLKELGNKGMAKEAKLALEELHPELKSLNKQDAAYVNLVEALERAVPRIENKDVVGLGAKVLMTGAHPWTAILEHTLGLPSVKGKLAFALNRARKMPKTPIGKDIMKTTGAGIAKTATTPDQMMTPIEQSLLTTEQ